MREQNSELPEKLNVVERVKNLGRHVVAQEVVFMLGSAVAADVLKVIDSIPSNGEALKAKLRFLMETIKN